MATPNRQSVHATKVVPWFDKKEFIDVYNDLFSDDIQLRRYGVEKVAVWKCRARQDLSIAIESSAALISVLCDHEEAQKAGTTAQLDYRLRSLYSMALIRFVNHVTERSQTRYYALPIHELAKNCGIPMWIVRLRHDATHKNLPSLDMLYSGTILALELLHADFWISNLPEIVVEAPDEIEEPEDEDVDVSRLKDIIQKFAEERCKKQQTSPDVNSHTHNLTVELQKLITGSNINQLISSIIDYGHMFSNKYFDLLGINQDDVLNSDLLLPAPLYNLWQPLLRTLKRLDLLTLFCEILISTVTNDSTLRNTLVTSWLIAICHNGLGCKTLFRWPHSLPWKRLLLLCLQNLNRFTHNVAKVIINKIDKGKFHKDAKMLQSLLSLYYDDIFTTTDCSRDKSTYSIDDVLTEVQSHTTRNGPTNGSSISDMSSDNRMWHLSCISTKWSSVPFGVLPGQNITYNSLELNCNGDRGHEATNSTGDRINSNDFDMVEMHSEREANSCNVWPEEYTETLKQKVVLF